MTTIQKQEWHHKATSWFKPMDLCCLSFWCPCFVVGRTHHRIKANGNMDDYQMCNLCCLGFYGLSCFGIQFVMPMVIRGDMRAKYHLEGNALKDFLCACCCLPCDVAQQDKESAFREQERGPLMAQPGMLDGMQYEVQQEQPAFHHG